MHYGLNVIFSEVEPVVCNIETKKPCPDAILPLKTPGPDDVPELL